MGEGGRRPDEGEGAWPSGAPGLLFSAAWLSLFEQLTFACAAALLLALGQPSDSAGGGAVQSRCSADSFGELFRVSRTGCGKRKADLRLDSGALGQAVVVPGKPSESELFQRITHADPEERMPPTDSGRALTPGDIETLRVWISQGAKWGKHWAFIPPKRPTIPPAIKLRLAKRRDRSFRSGQAAAGRAATFAARG